MHKYDYIENKRTKYFVISKNMLIFAFRYINI